MHQTAKGQINKNIKKNIDNLNATEKNSGCDPINHLCKFLKVKFKYDTFCHWAYKSKGDTLKYK